MSFFLSLSRSSGLYYSARALRVHSAACFIPWSTNYACFPLWPKHFLMNTKALFSIGFECQNWSLQVWALNRLIHTIMSKRLHITSMKTKRAKAGFITLHLPLLPCSLCNHCQTCFICPGSELVAVSPENSPGQPFQPIAEKRWWDIFRWSTFTFGCEQQWAVHSGASPQPWVLDHTLDSSLKTDKES